ncbi:DUF3954 domain-containing protein [Halalkalibacter sp. APA_J-10(15)]|uniref:DUF3954 domain-containing protein n=1 Tax=Halalkalibacter sp. APA_J-10(15) TaxID=2933805 RepID=UPI001FF640C3|nr:DUF3954 domain-containing protein [Halalkalibacter sp. APA_J-10(15)]MCK0471415.1 DUF3954 domain-containing protein [Halalkalibacter sp. APA_J-10(15)]
MEQRENYRCVMTKEIEIDQNKVYVVKNGEVITIEPPKNGYGSNVLVWNNGEVVRVDSMDQRKV